MISKAYLISNSNYVLNLGENVFPTERTERGEEGERERERYIFYLYMYTRMIKNIVKLNMTINYTNSFKLW